MPSYSAWDIINHTTLREGLIGHWKLNALTGASSNNAQDVGPNTLHGTAESYNNSTGAPAALPSVVSGKIRNALDFEPGTTSIIRQRVNLGNGASVRPASITVSAWVYLNDDGTHNADLYSSTIFGNYDWDGERKGIMFRYRPSGDGGPKWQFWCTTGTGTGGATAADWTDTPTWNTWYHFVGTYGNNIARMYVNGVLRGESVATESGNLYFESGIESWIGGLAASSQLSGQSGVMRGRIDEFTMWDRALDEGEVRILYNGGNARYFDMKTAGWWEFDGSTDALHMDGGDAHIFDPQVNTDDFTIAGAISPDLDTGIPQAMLVAGKINGDGDRCWWTVYDDGVMGFGVSADGSSVSAAPATGSIKAGDEAFFCARYAYVGAGTSDMWLRVDDSETSNLSAVGPVRSSETAPIEIGDGYYGPTPLERHFDGKIFWLAYWNRKLTDTEVDDLREGNVHPRQLNPDFYIDFHQAVAATYVSEVPEAAGYWTFDVEGTPTQGGSTQLTLPVPIGVADPRPFPHDVYEGGSVIEAGVVAPFATGFRTAVQRDAAQLRGRATALPPPRDLYEPTAGLKDYWWEFNGTSDALRKPGTDADAVVFDPQSNNDDFTVMGVFRPKSITGSKGIFGKWDENGVNQRCWLVQQSNDDFYFVTSKDGAVTGLSIVNILNQLVAGQDTFFCARYDFITDGTSHQKLRLDDSENTITNAYGPVYSNTGADVQIADFDDTVDLFYDGSIYWLAYWNRTLADWEVEGIRKGRIHPEELDPDYYEDFHENVGATLSSEIPSTTTIDFDVEGAPLAKNDNPKDYWWQFDGYGTGDALRLSGGSADAITFDPNSNNDDFTVAGVFNSDDASLTDGIMAKYDDDGVANRCWMVFHSPSQISVHVSKNGLLGDGNRTRVDAPGVVTGQDHFFCSRYRYVGDGTSDLRIRLDDTEVSDPTAVGPVYSTTSADVQIADYDTTVTREFEGKIYWLAYWNRKLTDNEVYSLRHGNVSPRDLNPDYYEDFSDAVASTNNSEVPYASPIGFTVEGTPTKAGSNTAESSVPRRTLIESGFSNPFSTGYRNTQTPSAQHRGNVALGIDPTSTIPWAMAFRIAGQKISAQHRGLASMLRFSRIRGR